MHHFSSRRPIGRPASSVVLITLLALLSGCSSSQTYPSRAENPWVIRTDFSSEDQWKTVEQLVSAAQTQFGINSFANVQFVSSSRFDGLAPVDLVHSLPSSYPGLFCIAADQTSMVNSEHTLLVIGFSPNSSDPKDYQRSPADVPADEIRTFRALPSTIQIIENNLSVANMNFEDFAGMVDENDVFRGFPELIDPPQ